jgi:hypothetical protein
VTVAPFFWATAVRERQAAKQISSVVIHLTRSVFLMLSKLTEFVLTIEQKKALFILRPVIPKGFKFVA